MSDIFISYSKSDRAKAQLLAEALEREGWTVWWDPKIPPGKTFDEVIEQALGAAKCVVVLWSTKSVSSNWVKTEAEEGRRRGILVPALVEYDLKIPLDFRRLHASQLADWRGEQEGHLEFEEVKNAVAQLVAATPKSVSPPPRLPPKAMAFSSYLLAAGTLALVIGMGYLGYHYLSAQKRGNYNRLIEKIGPRDPETEGFKTRHDVFGTVVYNQNKTNYEAWQVSTGRLGYYSHSLTKAQKEAAYRKGWRLSMEVQIVSGYAYANVDFAGVGKRFDINAKVEQNSELIVWLTTKIAPTLAGPEHRLGNVGGSYHRYELVFDPTSQAAELLVDGEKIEDVPQLREYRGLTEFQEDRGVFFGTALYRQDRGIANFKHVRFEINP